MSRLDKIQTVFLLLLTDSALSRTLDRPHKIYYNKVGYLLHKTACAVPY